MATQPICPAHIDTRTVTTTKAFWDLASVFFDMAPIVLKNRSEGASGERIFVAFAAADGALDTDNAISIDRGAVVPLSVPRGRTGLLVQASDGSPVLEIIVGMTGA